MTRLLHAAARGARVQFCLYENEWHTARDIDVSKDERWHQRIHPEDEHLQYGPISACVRDAAMAEYFTYGGTYTVPYGSYWLSMKDAHDVDSADVLHRSLFLLILAEALADEGL